MSDKGLAVLGQLFDAKHLYAISGGSVIVKEEDTQATLRQLQIDGVGSNAVVLRFDKAGHQTPFADKAVRQACDAILFCQFGDEGYILCVELKSGEPAREKYATQLLSAQCFVDYVVSIVKHFHGIEDCAQWQRRFFVFHDASKARIRKDLTLKTL